jgi:hypothetical protein
LLLGCVAGLGLEAFLQHRLIVKLGFDRPVALTVAPVKVVPTDAVATVLLLSGLVLRYRVAGATGTVSFGNI